MDYYTSIKNILIDNEINKKENKLVLECTSDDRFFSRKYLMV